MLSEPFGFTQEPFRLTPDTRFFFAGSNHEDIALQLLADSRESPAIGLLTGPAGSGKTLLLRWLAANLGEDVPSALIWGTHLSFDELLSSLCAQFHLTAEEDGRAHKLLQIETMARDCASRGCRPLLLLDEADTFSDGVLEGLAALADLNLAEGLPLFAMVFAAGEGFSRRLMQSALARRPLREYRLLPLEKNQIQEYLRHRLRQAGHKNGDLFTPEAIDRLFPASGGIPGLINGISGNALFLARMKAASRVDGQLIEEVIQDMGISGSQADAMPRSPASSGEPMGQAAVKDETKVLPFSAIPSELDQEPPFRRRADRKAGGRWFDRAIFIFGVAAFLVGAYFVTIAPNFVTPKAAPPADIADGQEKPASGPRLAKEPLGQPTSAVLPESIDRNHQPKKAAQPVARAEVKQPEPKQETIPEQTARGKVARAQLTSAIRQREPTDRLGPSIQGAGGKQLYYFTELRNMRGEVVSHRWEYEGRIVTEISFKIEGDSWRVYSQKQLTPATAGQWLVSVVDSKGQVIRSDSFSYDVN